MKTILIVDDDQRNTFALSAVLKAKGFATIVAHNMTDAFNVLDSEKQVGIILLDMMMPGIDGYTAIPLLKEKQEYANIPVIAVTAQAMRGDKEKCLEAGADEYIAKPVDLDMLMKILDARFK